VSRSPDRGRNEWLLALLPTFPLLLLVLRLWYLSRQDPQTMLLLVQYVSPLGLIATLLITLAWTLPVVVLGGRTLGTLLLLSSPTAAPDPTASQEVARPRSWLIRASERIPDWVVAAAVVFAALTWQLRFLPAMVMLALAILGLTVRHRYPGRTRLVRAVCLGLPLVVAAVEYVWLAPAIYDSLSVHQFTVAVLLSLPPALTILLTGPISARFASPVIHTIATAGLLGGPLAMGAIFLSAPVLPTTAVEVASGTTGQPVQVVIGHIISVDDQMTAILDEQGNVRYFLNQQVRSRVLCPGDESIPSIPISVHGWQVEQTALQWIAPRRAPAAIDQRCLGRPQTQD
jgi:hypothetical protein